MTRDNRQAPRRTRNAKGIRQAVKRETQGATANLKEDLTERDWARLEARAKRAMDSNAKRLEA